MTAGSGQRDESLGDFDAIVRVHRSRIFRFALASLRDADAAATVTQDCFLRAYRARGQYRGEAGVGTWLMRIAVNLVRDHVRNRRLMFWKRVRDTDSPATDLARWLPDGRRSPEAAMLLQEQVKSIWDAAKYLSERQRTVFLLRFVEDMELLEIAAATGLKEGTVKFHLFRAVHAIRKRMGVEE